MVKRCVICGINYWHLSRNGPDRYGIGWLKYLSVYAGLNGILNILGCLGKHIEIVVKQARRDWPYFLLHDVYHPSGIWSCGSMFCLSNSRAIPRGRVRRNRLRKKRAKQAGPRQDTDTVEETEVRVTLGQPDRSRGHQAMRVRRKSRLHLADDLSISSAISWLSSSNAIPGYPVTTHFYHQGIVGRANVNNDRHRDDSITRDINAVGASNNVPAALGVILCPDPTSVPCHGGFRATQGDVADDDIEDNYYYDNEGNLVTSSGARYKYNVGTGNRNSNNSNNNNNSNSYLSSSNTSSSFINTSSSDMPAITHFVLEGSRLIEPVRLFHCYNFTQFCCCFLSFISPMAHNASINFIYHDVH